MSEQPIIKKTKDDIKREEQLEEAAARATLASVGQLFGETPSNSQSKPEPYIYNSRENFSYSTNNGHMNEYQKAISNHQQNLNKPFNKMNGVGV